MKFCGRKPIKIQSRLGFSLLDAMIGVAILSIGLLGVAKFQSALTKNAISTKARSEALIIAQDRLEKFRHMSEISNFTALVDTEGEYGAGEAIEGTNAQFFRSFRVLDGPNNTKRIDVNVTWIDPKEGSQSLTMSGMIAWNDPKISSSIASDGVNSESGGVANPSGAVVLLSTDSYGSPPPGAIDNNDGTFTFHDNNRFELLNSDGDILLVINTAVLTISGTIYSTGDLGNLEVITSDYGYCVFPLRTDKADITVIDEASQLKKAPSKNQTYNTGTYTCYVASGWYGSLGVIDQSGTINNLLGCPDKARTYAVLTLDSEGKLMHQGITQSFTEQDFVIDTFNSEQPTCTDLQNQTSWGLDISSGLTDMSGGSIISIELSGTLENVTNNTGYSVTTSNGDSCVLSENVYTCTITTNSNTGWTGIVSIDAPDSYSCTPSTHSFTNQKIDSRNNNFDCQASVPVESTINLTGSIKGIRDYSKLSVIAKDDTSTVNCPIDKRKYTCTVTFKGNEWTGSISISGNDSCKPQEHTGINTNIDTSGFDFKCSQATPTRQITISGAATISAKRGKITGVSLSDGGNCKYTDETYSCTTAPFNSTWTGTVSFSSNKTICTDNPVKFIGISSDQTYNVVIAKNAGQCP